MNVHQTNLISSNIFIYEARHNLVFSFLTADYVINTKIVPKKGFFIQNCPNVLLMILKNVGNWTKRSKPPYKCGQEFPLET